MLGGRPTSRVTRSIDCTAAPRETLGGRLKDTVTAGNWPWWLTASAVARCSIVASVERGTWPPADDRKETRPRTDGSIRNSGSTSSTTRYWFSCVKTDEI